MAPYSHDSEDVLGDDDNTPAASKSQLLIPVKGGELAPIHQWPMMSAGVPEALTAAPTLSQLVHSLRRRWPLAVGLGLVLGGILAALIWVLSPISFESHATLRVNRSVEGGKAMGPDEYGLARKSQAQLIRSGFVISRVLKQDAVLNLATIREQPQPQQYLEKQLRVDILGDSELISVALKGDHSTDLPIIVNAVTNTYLSEIVNKERNDKELRRDKLQTKLTKKRADLSARWREYNNLVEQIGSSGSKQAETERQLIFNNLAVIRGKISEAESMLLRNEMDRLAVVARKEKKVDQKVVIPDYMLDNAIAQDRELQILQTRQAELREKVNSIESVDRRKEKAPEAIDMRKRIDSMQRQAEDRTAALRPQLTKQIEASMTNSRGPLPDQSADDNLNLLDRQKEKILSVYEKMKEEYTTMSERAKTLGQSSAGFESLRSELDALTELTRSLQRELDTLDLDLSIPSAMVTLIEAAPPTSEGTNPLYRYMLIVFGGVAGLGLATASVVFAEFQSRKINTTADINTGLGIRVLGSLPARGRRGGNADAVTESIDSIRTMMLKGGGADAPRVVMVTSAGEREGKTTVASQLAASLARAGRKTLIIDGDLRQPALHRLFDIALENGLCEVLRHEIDADEALLPTQVEGLWVMSAGECDQAAVMALSHDALKEIVRRLRAKFDCIILDSGPVLAYADSLLLGHYVDAAVLSVRRDLSQMPKVYEARERLEAVGIRVLGAVVNGVKPTPHRGVRGLPNRS